ncbi:SNF2 domain-containing protein [Actinidia rufa]|uniref:SNF2 domain-containing protein n=1 Tax=Actinidia rufa TaxID=165716 RepID=A0A7J0FVW9_9ERIC|nr:SNF2 domain-containing protein [Actinidia rufa]
MAEPPDDAPHKNTSSGFAVPIAGSSDLSPYKGIDAPTTACSRAATLEIDSKRKHASNGLRRGSLDKRDGLSFELPHSSKRPRKLTTDHIEYNETWVQYDACRKWRKLPDVTVVDSSTAWFCSMNNDPLHKSCIDPEESWDSCQPVTNLSADKLSEVESVDLVQPVFNTRVLSRGDEHESHKRFQAFGLIKSVEKSTTRCAEWSPRNRSVLVQVHWHRVLLDEGRTLGSSLNLKNKFQMAISLKVSNRWLLTGTPTPNTPNSQLSHLQPLLKFLHEETYGQNQKTWKAAIHRPFEAEMEEGRSRLLQLLHRCMICARKMDLQTIPPCIKKATFLDFTEEHARSYNELAGTVRCDILMADWNDPSHVTDAGQDIQETMDILVENCLDPISEAYGYIKYNIMYGGSCMRCKAWCGLPVITPCRHLLCLDCVALDSERCNFPGCGNLYEMQSPDDDWDPDWQSTSSSKVAFLVQRLKETARNEVTGNLQVCHRLNGSSYGWNMKEQVISRAHQMGAIRPIYVETLAMRGPVEEQMLKFLQTVHEEFGKPDHEGSRPHHALPDFSESNYLAHLSIVLTSSSTRGPIRPNLSKPVSVCIVGLPSLHQISIVTLNLAEETMAVVEIVIAASIKVLVEKLASGELWKFARRERIHTALEKWRGMLEEITAVLADAEEKQTKESIQKWLEDLEDLAYDLDDVLDEIATEA